jgi:hypothetical protein
MNKLKLELDILRGKDWMEYENIMYSNCAFIRLVIDGVNLITTTKDRKGVIVWDEIKKTLNQSGEYLILTCVCGIADDAGFDLVNVERNENTVSWKFNDESNWFWEFPKADYDHEIKRLEKEINELDISIPLEPDKVMFPE